MKSFSPQYPCELHLYCLLIFITDNSQVTDFINNIYITFLHYTKKIKKACFYCRCASILCMSVNLYFLPPTSSSNSPSCILTPSIPNSCITLQPAPFTAFEPTPVPIFHFFPSFPATLAESFNYSCTFKSQVNYYFFFFTNPSVSVHIHVF